MPFLQITYRGWVSMALVIALIAAIMNRFTMFAQLTPTFGETARWAVIQMPSIFAYWDALIVSFCILLNLRTRGYLLWDGSNKPPSLRPVSSPVTEDTGLQSSFNFLAAVQQRARRDRLATRYFWKWRLLMADRRIECLRATTIAAEVKHQEERQINCEVDAQDEQAKPFEEPGLEPSAQQPDDRSFEVDSQTWQDTLPAGSLSPIDPPKIEATAPPETSPLAESQPSQSPDNPASLRGAIEDAPEPAFVQPQLPEWRKKAKKGPSKFQRAPAGRTSGDDWLANNLAQEEGLTRPQGLSAPSFSSPRPGPWAPKNPKVPKEEQWGAENDASLKPKSRLADMVQGPVKVTKCALDRDCRAPVCGKAHHGPCTDPTTPFMPEKWCWYNQECDRSSCQRWHLSPASADPPAEGSSLEGQW